MHVASDADEQAKGQNHSTMLIFLVVVLELPTGVVNLSSALEFFCSHRSTFSLSLLARAACI